MGASNTAKSIGDWNMWRKYETAEKIGKRIVGISKKESIHADNASGVVRHPKTGERIYWDGK